MIMPILFMMLGALVWALVWIVIPDEITKPIDEAIQNGLRKLTSYVKKGPKEPYEE